MAKHVKFYSGHTVKEWENKYKKQIAKGKIKVFNNEKDLIDFAYYWKIDGKYYQVPNIFEWYNKSLRKSVGLTVALTGTSVLATFFLVAALVQSQVKWNADKYGLSVSFYAGDGTFSDGSKSKVVSGITKGTKLKNIPGYKKIANPTATDPDYKFGDWVVDDGQEMTTYTDETPITKSVSLKAAFDMKPDDPVKFDDDTWETVFSVIEEGKDTFIDTYCKDFPSYNPDHTKTEEREKALFEFMDSPINWKIITVGNVGGYGVRLIGLGQDKQANSDSKKVDRALATFEFNECIMQLPYSFEQGGSPYYTKSGSSDPSQRFGFCALKTYTEDIVKTQLPSYIQRKMKTVIKRTLQIKGGLSNHYNETLQSWEFKEECLANLEMVETEETLFSLSMDEIGASKIPFKYKNGDTEIDGQQMMSETTHAANNLFTEKYKEKGEGFFNGTDYTGEYLFYSKDWDKPTEHNYGTKRIKQYFVGDDPKGVEAQYRLRSIYIPNGFDKDKDGGTDPVKHTSGNKDYRPFETWNINTNGDIGHVKKSGPLDGDKQYWFACSDMAWASVFVAPAFCL